MEEKKPDCQSEKLMQTSAELINLGGWRRRSCVQAILRAYIALGRFKELISHPKHAAGQINKQTNKQRSIDRGNKAAQINLIRPTAGSNSNERTADA